MLPRFQDLGFSGMREMIPKICASRGLRLPTWMYRSLGAFSLVAKDQGRTTPFIEIRLSIRLRLRRWVKSFVEALKRLRPLLAEAPTAPASVTKLLGGTSSRYGGGMLDEDLTLLDAKGILRVPKGTMWDRCVEHFDL